MKEVNVGSVVYSKSGRDKGRYYVVVDVDNEDKEYIHIVDGCLRKVTSPKRKKKKHISAKPFMVEEDIRIKIETKKVSDSDIRKSLRASGYEVSKED